MAKGTLADQIEAERTRLNDARSDAMARRSAIDEELTEIDRLLNAANAYEAALTGKTTSRKTGTRGPRSSGRTANLLALIQNTPDGMKRADILEKMGVKGDKSGENSVSTALTNLKKQSKIGLKDGLYTAA